MRGLALQNLREAFSSTALAQGIIERSEFSVQRLQALSPLGLDTVDAIGDGELLRTSGLRGLCVPLDHEALPRNALPRSALALLRLSIRLSGGGLTLDRPGQHQQPFK